ncbi:uncharacterized protein LOC129889377 isoform X2 [Solanum dulcamara]|uniref:uncharacterized protein LOC129889377 isoform X2 n=1 Tax=Solanum dulcamara TaxID=45834 RepID=UPI002486B047|nr:uncharacterized protein LOC129889377 isoform X2 [Solanum dulcamara]
MGNRIARIQNDTLWSISMKEHRMLGGSTSQYSYTVRVDANDNTEIPASLFLKRNHQSGMPSEIVIFTDGTEVRESLISQDFVRYVKIILCVEGPYLVVKGVLPQFLDLCWFRPCNVSLLPAIFASLFLPCTWIAALELSVLQKQPFYLHEVVIRGCGFLGREYRGRQGVTIMRCRISTLLEVVHTLFFF